MRAEFIGRTRVNPVTGHTERWFLSQAKLRRKQAASALLVLLLLFFTIFVNQVGGGG